MNADMQNQTAQSTDDVHALAQALVAEVEKVVIGKRHEIVMLITALLAGGHVLIEDVPGVGKTTLAAALAAAAGLKFKRAQFTPDVMASDITGFNTLCFNLFFTAEEIDFSDSFFFGFICIIKHAVRFDTSGINAEK